MKLSSFYSNRVVVLVLALDLSAKLETTKKRIRKRDRVLLYGKKIVRKVFLLH